MNTAAISPQPCADIVGGSGWRGGLVLGISYLFFLFITFFVNLPTHRPSSVNHYKADGVGNDGGVVGHK